MMIDIRPPCLMLTVVMLYSTILHSTPTNSPIVHGTPTNSTLVPSTATNSTIVHTPPKASFPLL